MTRAPAIPMPLLAVAMLPSAPLLAWAATMLRLQRGQLAPQPWMTVAEIALVAYEIALVAWLLALRLRPHGQLASRMRERGVGPERILAPVGLAIFLFPTCAAFFLSFVGLPLSHLYAAAVFSFMAMAAWAWWYKSRA